MAYITRRKHPVARRPVSQSLSLGSAVLTGLMASTAGAAGLPDDTPAAYRLDEVSVQSPHTGNYKSDRLTTPKFTQPISETPRTIQVINKQLMHDQQATTLTEALRNSPGVGTFYAGENGASTTGDSVYMRGFDSSGSIFVDGVRDLGSISRDVFNTEQVEVIKGPAGADYGRTAPTGSINLATKQAFQGDLSAASLTGGSDGQKRTTLDLNRRLTDSLAGRLNLMAQDSDVAGRDTVNNSRWGIAPALTLDLNERARLAFNFLHITQNNVPDGGVSTVGLPGYTTPDPAFPQISEAPKVDSENFYGAESDHDDAEVNMATVLFEYELTDRTRLHNTLRWGRTRQDYRLTAIMGVNANGSTDPADWTVRRLPNLKDQTNTILTNQTGLVTELDTGSVSHTLSYGVEVTREEIETRGLSRPTVPDASPYDPNDNFYYGASKDGSRGEGTTDTVAGYLFDTLTFGEHWQLNGGVRLDRYRADYESTTACTGGGRDPAACAGQAVGTVVPSVDTDSSDTLFNWKAGVLHKTTPWLNLYADYAVSHQPPGGENLQLSDSERSADNANYDPQKARTAEVGAKWKLAHNQLLLTTALYRTEVSDLVEQDPTDGNYYQTGEKRVQGVEVSVVGNITPNWNLSAGYTTMNATVEEGAAQSQDGGSRLTYTPEHAFTSWTTYRLPFDLTVGAGARYTGGLKRGRDGAVGTPDHTEGYWVADAMARYPLNRNVDLQLNVYNLFDEEYVAAINKSGYRYTPGTPRTALLSVNIHY
ncbi:MAG: catecholate siderophore receptor Fiu [Alcanivorax sp.]